MKRDLVKPEDELCHYSNCQEANLLLTNAIKS